MVNERTIKASALQALQARIYCGHWRINKGGGELTRASQVEHTVTDGARFLFIGNSHTFTNDLPGTFCELAWTREGW